MVFTNYDNVDTSISNSMLAACNCFISLDLWKQNLSQTWRNLPELNQKGKNTTDEQIMETSKSLYRLRLIPLLFSLCPMLQWSNGNGCVAILDEVAEIYWLITK